jgi:hypothetical protein
MAADTESVNKLRIVSELPPSVQSPYDEWGPDAIPGERSVRLCSRARCVGVAGHRRAGAGPHLGIRGSSLIQRLPSAALDAIDDAETLHASVVVHSYALAEFAVADRLPMDPRSFGGIEDWGAPATHGERSRLDRGEGRPSWGSRDRRDTERLCARSRTLDAAAGTRLLVAGPGAQQCQRALASH